MQSNEFQARMAGDPFDHLAADIPGGYLEHPYRLSHGHYLSASV
jgi:hypothetical protein